jgi:hypothetical protein
MLPSSLFGINGDRNERIEEQTTQPPAALTFPNTGFITGSGLSTEMRDLSNQSQQINMLG